MRKSQNFNIFDFIHNLAEAADNYSKSAELSTKKTLVENVEEYTERKRKTGYQSNCYVINKSKIDDYLN